jgi:hypothetical protein
MTAMPSEQEQADKAKDCIIEIQSKLFDKAVAYSNLIMLGGYAGAFAIWSYTKPQLPERANIIVAFLLGISLAVFIFFEVFKMATNARHFLRVTNDLKTATTPKDFLDKWKFIEVDEAKASLIATRVWALNLIICVGTALGATVILFYNFFAFLVGLRLWPA